jgi:hypothetical protein
MDFLTMRRTAAFYTSQEKPVVKIGKITVSEEI